MLLSRIGVLASGGGEAGGFESIATVTATSGQTSLTFTSIPQTYASLQLRGIGKSDFTGVNWTYLKLQLNSITSYAYHELTGSGSAAAAAGYTSYPIYIGSIPDSTSGQASIYGVTITDLHDYASTTRNKTVRAFGGHDMNNTQGNIRLTSGLAVSTAAVNSLTLSLEHGGFVAGSTFALYGVKAAA